VVSRIWWRPSIVLVLVLGMELVEEWSCGTHSLQAPSEDENEDDDEND
jgi:hypothetical protein